MFASETMPRSITQIRSAWPYFSYIPRTICSGGAHVGAVAREHLKTQGQPLRRADQPDADLFVARTLVAGVATLGLRVALGLALEVGAGHVVEQNSKRTPNHWQ
jgi:hypothetical protein